MILSDNELKILQQNSNIPQSSQIGPCSIDLCLSRSFCRPQPQTDVVSLHDEVPHESFEADQIILAPQEFILASTEEEINVPKEFAAYVEGRSSIGRLGLQVQNAGFIDSGFYGRITLEIANQANFSIQLTAGVRICQIVFLQLTSPPQKTYAGKYNGQFLATPSRINQDKEVSQTKEQN